MEFLCHLPLLAVKNEPPTLPATLRAPPVPGENELGSKPRLLPRREERAHEHHAGERGLCAGEEIQLLSCSSPQRRIRQLRSPEHHDWPNPPPPFHRVGNRPPAPHLRCRAPSSRSRLREDEPCYYHVWTPWTAVLSWGGAIRAARSAAWEERHAGRACRPAPRRRKP